MTRPRYETAEDRAAEQAVANVIATEFGYAMYKLPLAYEVDYAAMDVKGRLHGFVEVKVRSKRYDTLILSMHKVSALHNSARTFNVKAAVAVQWPDGPPEIMVLTEYRLTQAEVYWGGRKDRGDDQDEEPVVHFPAKWFTPIGQ